MNTFFISLKNEVLKLKNTFAFWITIISALFIPTIYFIYYTLKYESLIPAEGVNPWSKFMIDQIMSSASLLLPLFIVLLTSLIVQVEHKSSAFKYIFSLPIKKSDVYFGKLSIVLISVTFTYLLFIVCMLLSGFLAGLIHSELNFLSFTPDFDQPLKLIFRSFIGVLGILAFQFWLSFRFKNFIVPLSIGIVLVIAGLVVFQAEEAIYFPYAYGRLSLFQTAIEPSLQWFPNTSLYSSIYFIIFSIFGYLSIRKLNVK